MLVHRSIIRRSLHNGPNSYSTSRTAFQFPGFSPCSRCFATSRKDFHAKASSTVQVGTSYEHLCARTLPRLDFQDLTRTGGRGDKGIDLLGRWLPLFLQRTKSPPLKVVVQCRAMARKAGPAMIRELEGALAGAPGEWRGADTIGVLCARRQVTAGVRDALRSSKRGVVWVMVEESVGARKEGKKGTSEGLDEGAEDSEESEGTSEGRIRQVLWNDRVQELVGEVTGTGVVHVPGEEGGRMETEVLMSYNGELATLNHYGQ